jgi:hypothetical protein
MLALQRRNRRMTAMMKVQGKRKEKGKEKDEETGRRKEKNEVPGAFQLPHYPVYSHLPQ